ncbi:MAG: acyltransferase family protein [Oscillospiraceae bacterium]|nr:acyltransferase family protein [Oscillospiraceae bacterium]
MKKRDHSIDTIRGLLMILVVAGHVMEFLRKENSGVQFLYNFIYFFHMPVFIFITGFLSKNAEKGRRRAVETYFVPFILFNLIWNCITLLSNFFVPPEAFHSDTSAYFSFFTPGWALWFMLSLFLWKIFLPDIIRIKNALAVSLAVGILSGLFVEFGAFMSLSRTITFLPYFLAGFYCSQERVDRIKTMNRAWSVALLAVGILAAYIFGNVLKIPSEMLWGDRSYNHYMEHILSGLAVAAVRYAIGFAFVFVLFNGIRGENRLLARIGRNTLSVYFLHTYLAGPLMAAAGYITNAYAQLAVLLAGAAAITLALSSAPVARWFGRLIERFNRAIWKQPGDNKI